MIYEAARHLSPAPYTDASPVLGTDTNGNTESTTLGAAALFRQPDDGIAGFLARGGVIADYVPPDVVPPVLAPSLYAVAQLAVTSGEITGIDINSRFSAALYIDVGLYYIFFTQTQPNTAYLAKAYDAGARVSVIERAEDFIVVTAANESGDPTDPAEISIEIIRVG